MNILHVLPEPPPQTETSAQAMAFTAPNLLNWLNHATDHELDELPFGVIAMWGDGIVANYNAAESRFAGLHPDDVIGHNMFTTVAPCTNNFMVAHRFMFEQKFDVIIDYVFTFRIAPIKVQLRLMKHTDCRRMFMAVQRDV